MKQGQKTTKLRISVCNNAEWLREHVAGEVWEAAGDRFTDDELRNIVNGAIHESLLDLQMREGWWMIATDASYFHDWNGKGHTAHPGIRTLQDIDAGQDASLFEAVCAAIENAKKLVSECKCKSCVTDRIMQQRKEWLANKATRKDQDNDQDNG